MWNTNRSAFQSMLVSYEIAFHAGLIRISFSGTFGSTESTRLSGEGLLKISLLIMLPCVRWVNTMYPEIAILEQPMDDTSVDICVIVANQLKVDVLRLLP